MKNRKKILASLVCFGSLGFLSSQATAATIWYEAGYSDGDNGEFTIYNSDLDLTDYSVKAKNLFGTDPDNINFQTFCIEYNEFFYESEEIHIAEPNASANLGGVGGKVTPPGGSSSIDPISKGTAYLYYMFATGKAGDSFANGGWEYNYTAGDNRVASARDLQQAIWALEEEVSLDNIPDYLETFLTTKFTSIGTAMENQGGGDFFDVYALNVTSGSGERLQDQLYYNKENSERPAPDSGSALLLLGMALGGIGFFQQRLKK